MEEPSRPSRGWGEMTIRVVSTCSSTSFASVQGQRIEQAHIPTLDVHIATLRG